jgi:hypothetical protein
MPNNSAQFLLDHFLHGLTHSTSTPSGVLITRYVRSGEVRTGTFEEVEQQKKKTA